MSMSRKAHLAPEGKSGRYYKLKGCTGRADFFSHKSPCEVHQPPEPLGGPPEFLNGAGRGSCDSRFGREKVDPHKHAEQLFQSLRERRLWRRRADHRRWIGSFILVDIEHTVLLTLRFSQYVSVGHARAVARRVVDWLEGIVTSWVKIFERGRGGVHVHLILRLSGELRVRTGVELIEIGIDSCRRDRDHLAQPLVERVESAAATACYLTKTLTLEQAHNRVPGRCITYSGDVEKLPWWLDSSRGGAAA
jgi:hypothetical protein